MTVGSTLMGSSVVASTTMISPYSVAVGGRATSSTGRFSLALSVRFSPS